MGRVPGVGPGQVNRPSFLEGKSPCGSSAPSWLHLWPHCSLPERSARAPPPDRSPKRVIDEVPPRDHQVTYNAFRLKGTVTEPQADGTVLPYADQKVKILKKKCGTCKWKVVKRVKTNDRGIFKTRIYAPERGRWKWRSKVDHSNGFGNTKGKVWTLYFR